MPWNIDREKGAEHAYLQLYEQLRAAIVSGAKCDSMSKRRPLLQQKRRSLKASNLYEMNQKLVRFALSRGFTYDIIRQCGIDEADED